MGVNGLGPAMSFDGTSDLLNGISVWEGSISIPLASAPPTVRNARFTLTFTDLASQPLALVDSTTVTGFTGSQMGLLLVTDPAGFNANWLFEIADVAGTTYAAAGPTFDALLTIDGNSLDSSVGGGFYYSVPEPAVMGLVGFFAAGIWFVRRVFPSV